MHALRGAEPVYHHVGRVIYNGSMPFQAWTNPPVEPLTEKEKQTILDWVKAGAPKGTCEPAAPAPSASVPTRRSGKKRERSTTSPPAPPSADRSGI